MKRRNALVVSLFVVAALGLAVALFYPREEPEPSVAVHLRSLETNGAGEVMARFAVSNEMKVKLGFGYGVQIETDKGWAHTNGDVRAF